MNWYWKLLIQLLTLSIENGGIYNMYGNEISTNYKTALVFMNLEVIVRRKQALRGRETSEKDILQALLEYWISKLYAYFF